MRAHTEESILALIEPEPTSGCWIWLGQRDGRYGRVRYSQKYGRHRCHAHRVVYELLIGNIPTGKELDHRCRNRYCVNPQHLEPVFHYENIMRGESLQARNARKERCPRGHLYDITVNKGLGRWCSCCRQEWNRSDKNARSIH